MPKHWTDETDQEAQRFFSTLTEREIRRRQDLCYAQIQTAFRNKNADALADLERMASALREEMLRRLNDGRR